MGDRIVLKPSGKITSLNVESLRESFFSQLDGITDPDVVVDMAEVYFISSAGLRLIMQLQKMAPSIQLINLSPDVYDVFAVTGLTQIMNIRRMYKEIFVDGLEVLGKGATAVVYRINNEQIVKICNEDVKEEDLLQEQERTRKALLAGVPTMLSFDTVRAGDRVGAIYEAFNYKTLASVYVSASDTERNELVKKYARTVRRMNSIEIEPEDFSDLKVLFKERLEKTKGRLDEKSYAICCDMIDQIPDEHWFVHGDCHMQNLMVDQDGELVVIDLGISGYGNSVFALSGVAHYKVFTELITDESAFKEKAEISRAQAEELYHHFMAAYCENLDEKKRALADQGVYLYSCLFSAVEYAGSPLVSDECFKTLTDRVVKVSEEGFDYTQMFESLRECLQETQE